MISASVKKVQLKKNRTQRVETGERENNLGLHTTLELQQCKRKETSTAEEIRRRETIEELALMFLCSSRPSDCAACTTFSWMCLCVILHWGCVLVVSVARCVLIQTKINLLIANLFSNSQIPGGLGSLVATASKTVEGSIVSPLSSLNVAICISYKS